MAEKPAGITPAQTVGPFFAYCLTPQGYPLAALVTGDLVTPDAVGERIRIEGRVLDGQDAPVPDAFLEIWQADGEGRYARKPAAPGANARFLGFGRAACDADGRYVIDTVKPGPVPRPGGGLQAPHLAVAVFARGLLNHLVTRIYFEGEPANASDPVLALIPRERRDTVITRRAAGGAVFQLDIHLQGPAETVFFRA